MDGECLLTLNVEAEEAAQSVALRREAGVYLLLLRCVGRAHLALVQTTGARLQSIEQQPRVGLMLLLLAARILRDCVSPPPELLSQVLIFSAHI